MRGKGMRRAVALAAAFAIGAVAHAQAPEFNPAVTDVTVFKDGHALIMARAKAKLENGWCRTRDVPAPVLGTFWAFAADKNSAVDFVRAGTVEVKEDRPCLTMDEIIQANTGKSVSIVAQVPGAPPVTYAGTLLGILENESKDEVPVVAQSGPRYDLYGRPNEPPGASVERKSKTLASFVMLKEDKSVRMIKRENVVSLNVDDPPHGLGAKPASCAKSRCTSSAPTANRPAPKAKWASSTFRRESGGSRSTAWNSSKAARRA